MSRKQYSKELKLELVKKHLPIKEHKGLKTEISFSFYGAKFFVKKISTHILTVLTIGDILKTVIRNYLYKTQPLRVTFLKSRGSCVLYIKIGG